MATRVQSLVVGMGLAKESAYNTASSSFIRFEKTNMDITSPESNNETDATWIGKGVEFAENLYPVNNDTSNKIEKYGSVEFMTAALAYGLGNVSQTSGTYTITAMNPSTSLQLPSFSWVEQVEESGSAAIDNLYTGCCVENLGIKFQYGPGLKSVTCDMAWRGSGATTSPSGVSVPATQTDHHALGSGMALTINGVDYVAAATGLEGSFTWNNNLMANEGYYIGSGLDAAGYANRGRLWYGNRVAGFDFTVLLLNSSAEYSKLRALTTGTATMTFNYDSTHQVVIELQKVGFKKVMNTQTNGLVSVRVTAEPMYDLTNGIITVTAKCPISGIAQ